MFGGEEVKMGKLIKKTRQERGIVYTIQVNDNTIDVLFLYHAIDRMKKWNITEEMVIETLAMPEEVLTGHRGRYIAHRRYGNHIIRAIYEYEDNMPVVITVYFPYAERYFQGGGKYEDKIF
jgi:hypothetical protein